MENNKDIDDLFRDIVESNEMDHSKKVWASLENHLEKKSNDRNKGIIFRLRLVLGILLFLFGSFAFYYIFNSNETNSKSLAMLEQSKTENVAKAIEKNKASLKSNTNENISSIKNSEKSNIHASKNNAVVSKADKQLRLEKTNSWNPLASNKPKTLEKSIVVNSKNGSANIQEQFSGIIEKRNSDSIVKNNSENIVTLAITDTNNITMKFDSTNQLMPTNTAVSVLSKVELDSIQKSQLKKRISLIAYFSPDLTMKYLKDNDNTDNQNEGDYNNNEVPDFSYNTGLLLGYDVSKNWSVKFGGSYAYLSQTIKPKTVYAKTGTDGLAHYQFNTTYGTSELPRDQTPVPIVGDSININTNSIQSLQVIGIPLIAKYQINRKKFSYYAQGGVSLNFLIGEKLIIETQNKSETIKNIEGLNEYYFGGIIGLGIAYKPTNRFSFLFEPTIKGAITPINKNTPVTTRPISFGATLGLALHF